MSILCVYISDIAVITAKNVDYRCIIHDINKSEATLLLENSVLDDHTYKKVKENLFDNCYFYNFVNVEKLETKNILTD